MEELLGSSVDSAMPDTALLKLLQRQELRKAEAKALVEELVDSNTFPLSTFNVAVPTSSFR